MCEVYGNTKTMNLNSLILTNIQQSPYFRDKLLKITTYSDLIDEIFYKVDHLEPWQRGTRSLANNKGMCGGVRGVGTGGVVSSSFCLLYRLHTLKPTKNQIQNTLNHIDSPYIRGIGFMYLRYTLDPKKLWKWFSRYLKDDEPIDVRAGGGNEMTIGQLVRHFLENIEWYDTLFPRIPVPIQKEVRQQLTEYDKKNQQNQKIDKNVINNINVKGFRTRSRSPCKNSRRHYIH